MSKQSIRATWRALADIYSARSLLFDQVFAGSSYRMLGADLLPGMINSKRGRRAAAVLKDAPDNTLGALAQMADVNIQRTGDLFKAVAVCYITLPLAIAAFLSDAAPEQVRAMLESSSRGVFLLVGMLALGPIAYFISHWRAKQIGWAIALRRAGVLDEAL